MNDMGVVHSLPRGAQALPFDRDARCDAEFRAALDWLLPPTVVRHGGRIETLQSPLHPAEAALVRGAVTRRRLEFTAGRTCAHRALEQLGLPDLPLCMGARRQPLWPTDVVGSISHAAGYCVAAASRRSQFAALGIDIEAASPLSDALLDLVCTPREKAWCVSQPGRLGGLMAKFMFSAKEAVFKCLFPVFGVELEFEDVALELEAPAGRFHARVSRLALNVDSDLELQGRLACTSSLLLTSVVLPEANVQTLPQGGRARQPVPRHDSYRCCWH